MKNIACVLYWMNREKKYYVCMVDVTYLLCISVLSMVVQGEILVDGVVQSVGRAENSRFLVLIVSEA